MVVCNLFREIALKHVEGYSELSESKKEIFDQLYKNFLSSLPINQRVNYTERHLQRVFHNQIQGIFHLSFDNEETIKIEYDILGKWER